MKALKVVFEPDEGGWWTVTIPEVKGVLSDGRTIAEGLRRVREALALAEDEGWDEKRAAAVSLIEDVRLPADVRKTRDARSEALRELAAAAGDVERTTADLVRKLTELGRSRRDVAALVNLSPARVQQILEDPGAGVHQTVRRLRGEGIRVDRRAAAARTSKT